jgi:hypothetical protein
MRVVVFPCLGEGVGGRVSSRSDFFSATSRRLLGGAGPPQRVAAYARSGRSTAAGVSGEPRRPGTLTANPTAAMYDAVALAGRGCGLMATVDIPAGTVVLQEDPVLVYTTHAARGAVCAACLRLVDAQASACACPHCGALIWFAACVALWLCSSFAERRLLWEGGGAVIAVSGVSEKRDVFVELAAVWGGVGAARTLAGFQGRTPRRERETERETEREREREWERSTVHALSMWSEQRSDREGSSDGLAEGAYCTTRFATQTARRASATTSAGQWRRRRAGRTHPPRARR